MSQLAEQARVLLLRDGAERAARRATRIGAYLEGVIADGAEPSAALLMEFNAAYAVAEKAKLEYDYAASTRGNGESDGPRDA